MEGTSRVGGVGQRVRPSYTIRLCDFEVDHLLGGRIHVVHEIAFLDGYYEPTLVVYVESFFLALSHYPKEKLY